MYDIGIIGGGTAGLTAAIYGQRAGKRTLVIEGLNFGGQIVNSPKVENYPGLESISGSQYSMNLLNQAMKLGAADYIAKPLNRMSCWVRSRNLCTWRRRLRRESRFLRPRIFISRGRAKRPASFMSMCVWWLRRICRYW